VKRLLVNRLCGLGIVALSLLATRAYTICSGGTVNGVQDIQGCANYYGCGSYTMLSPIVQYKGCSTYCCPNDPVVYFNPVSCDSGPTTPTTILGEPYCCANRSDIGKLYAQVACATATSPGGPPE